MIKMGTKKVNFQNSKGKNLVGILHFPEKKTNSIIILAHGFCSNKDRPRYIEVAKDLVEEGFAFLRFDLGGSGESYETEITIENQIDDLKSAIKFVKDKGYNKIGLQGESLGGLVSILVYNPKIKALVLLAPVTKSKDKLKEVLEQEKLSREALKKRGYVIKKKDEKDFKIPMQYFEEGLKVNQQEMLSKVKIPVLIIHGDEDDVVPLADSKEAMKYLPKNSKLEIIEGVGHKISSWSHNAIPAISNWFKENLK